jgi:NADH:ubiquinone oxidoreductase subunit
MDVNGQTYFPKEWQTAESQNQAGKNAKKTTAEEIKAATALYTSAADAYDDIAGKSRPLFAKDSDDAQKALQMAMARAEQSRKAAADASGQTYFPKEWQTAESQNQAGKNAKKTTAAEIKAAAALYMAAADGYDDITGKSRALIAQQQEQQGVLKSLQDAITRAEQSRKQALGFQGHDYFPREWQGAETQNRSAQEAKRNTPDEIKTALDLYTAAANAYDNITNRSRSRYIQNWEDLLRRERAAAVNAGIDTIAPEHLSAADRVAAETRSQLSAADYVPNEADAVFPIDMYRSLKPRADGYKVRQEIVERGFSSAAPAAMAAADRNTRAAVQDYDRKDPKSSKNKADEALAQYTEALMNGWLAFAQSRQLEAGKERQAAIDVKANIAVREDFNRADTIYQQALTDFNAKSFESAGDLYNQAASRFIAAARDAEEKRRKAEEMIDMAKQKTAESAAHATNVGLTMEGNNESR